MEIGTLKLSGRVTLAPMAGVTDSAFRTLCLEQGAALVTTEMVSAKALCYNDKKTAQLLYIPPEAHPTAVQIFGHESDIMAEGAVRALALSGADAIDINMGCPVGKIVKGGDGSALMLQPALAGEIISAVAKAVPVPVTVKFRKGWDGGSVNAVEFARMCEASGAAAIAIHGRTRVQMYAGKADWDIIRDAARAVSIPVIANGDVADGPDAAHILRYTGAAGCMIGRGAFGDPWIFARANAALRGEPIPPVPPLAARMDMALRAVEDAAAVKGEKLACIEARGQLPWYLRGVSHSACWKQELVRVNTLDDVRACVRGIKRDLA